MRNIISVFMVFCLLRMSGDRSEPVFRESMEGYCRDCPVRAAGSISVKLVYISGLLL